MSLKGIKFSDVSGNQYQLDIPTDYVTETDLSDVVTYDSVSTTLEPTLLASYYNKTQTDTLLAGKQSTLVSGTNIKTINNQSLLGSGNITIQGSSGQSEIPVIEITAETITVEETTIINLPISNADWALLTDGTFAQFKVDLSNVYSSLSSVDITYITNSLDIADFDAYMILNAKSNLSSSTIGGMYLTSDFKNFGAGAEWNFCGSISVTEADSHEYKTLLITSQNIENFATQNDIYPYVKLSSPAIDTTTTSTLKTFNIQTITGDTDTSHIYEIYGYWHLYKTDTAYGWLWSDLWGYTNDDGSSKVLVNTTSNSRVAQVAFTIPCYAKTNGLNAKINTSANESVIAIFGYRRIK